MFGSWAGGWRMTLVILAGKPWRADDELLPLERADP
jgi:hypothetical protein